MFLLATVSSDPETLTLGKNAYNSSGGQPADESFFHFLGSKHMRVTLTGTKFALREKTSSNLSAKG